MSARGVQVARHMIWKERRSLQGFWLALTALLTLLKLLLIAVWSMETRAGLWELLAFDAGATALYALGCVVTSIANEHEEGTAGWLQTLPVSPALLLWPKLMFAVLSSGLFIACNGALSLYLDRWQLPQSYSLADVGATFGVAVFEAIAYGVLIACLVRKPLIAICLTIGVLSVVANVCSTFSPEYTAGQVPQLSWYRETVLPRLLLAASVALLDVWLVPRWLNEQSRTTRFQYLRARPARRRSRDTASRGTAVQRLLWQSAREMWGHYLALTVLAAVVLWLIVPHTQKFDPQAVWAFLVIAAVLLGSVVYLQDQRGRRYLFFGEHGVSGRWVWISRHTLPAGIVTLLSLAAIGLRNFMPDPEQYSSDVGPVLLVVALVYASGQFASMLLRSGLLAAVGGVALAMLLGFWMLSMYMFEVPRWWSVLPLPAVLMAATWVRSSNWVIDRNGLQGWWPMWAVALVPSAALLTAVPMYRIGEIPNVEPGFDVDRYLSSIPGSEARQTADMYRRAFELTSAADRPSVRQGVALCIEASKRPSCLFYDPRTDSFDRYVIDLKRMSELGKRLADSARYTVNPDLLDDLHGLVLLRMANHLRQNALPEAISVIIGLDQAGYRWLHRWSTERGQTAENVQRILPQLIAVQRETPPSEQMVMSNYVNALRVLEGDEAAAPDMLGIELSSTTMSLPWERARGKRALRMLTAESLAGVSRTQQSMAEMRRVEYSPRREDNWSRTTPIVLLIGWSLVRDQLEWYDIAAEAYRRAGGLQLALAWWKLEHGELPPLLENLIPEVLEALPSDPYTGDPFWYFDRGVSTRIYAPANSGVPFAPGWHIMADQPFLWTPGLASIVDEKWIERVKAGPIDSDSFSIFSRGWAFPVGR